MLQRAASNAYSWWWASHIRTKQSKWLDNNLQDMEDKVNSMLRLIEEDADTFAKKAEMYFKRRPELINFVQESYKSYRALAERYDHISGELQKANNAIATVFPDQVQFGMDDDDDDVNCPKTTTTAIDVSKFQKRSPQNRLVEANKDIKSPTTKTKLKLNKACSEANTEKAPEQINKLHKEILVLQTEKEFLKSSYEIGLAKYWDIEKKISDLQEKICSLQDNYSGDAIIEDDEARAVMAVAALKSCEDTLVKLHEQQKKTIEESRVESQRMKNAKEKLRALRKEYGQPEPDGHNSSEDAAELNSTNESLEEEVCGLNEERLELPYVCEKVRKTFEMNSEMSVLDLAEKIDELVGKVVVMETTVSSLKAQIQRLRLENDELQSSLHSLEEEKTTLVHNTKDLCDKLKHAEEELHKIQDLDKFITDENTKLQISFSEVCGTFNYLSDKLQSPGQQDETDRSGSQKEEGTSNKREPEMVQVGEEISVSLGDEKVRKTLEEENFKNLADGSADSTSNKLEEGCSSKQLTFLVDAADHEVALIQNIGVERPKESKSDDQENSTKPLEEEGEVATNNSSQQTNNSSESVVPENEHGYNNLSQESIDDQDDMDLPDWQQLFLSGLEDREKILLAEYTSILRNFKDTKRKLTEAEKKNQDNLFETVAQVRDLKSVIVMRDEEINSLKQKLNFLESSLVQQGDDHVVGIESSEDHQTTSTENEETSTASNENVVGKPKHRRVQWGMTTDANPEESDAKSLHLQSDDLPQIDEPTATTATEEKFRKEIDELLEENLQFWMRFSSSFQQVQKYKVEVREIQLKLQKLRDNRRQEGSSSSRGEPSVKPEVTAYYKQLKDMQTGLSTWIEQNAHLKEELQRRFSSLCNIKEEISKALEDNKGSQELQFSPYQASKFQGEVLNMLQENNKVADELQSGLKRVKGVQVEVHMTLAKLTENFELSGSKGHYHNFRNFSSRTRIPLRSFIFGAKTKKPSLFACMNPALQKQYSDLRAGLPP